MDQINVLWHALAQWLAVPSVGLWGVFITAFVSATLLPMGSEPAVILMVSTHPDLFWLTIAVASLGNTLGGMLTWLMGLGAEKAWENVRHQKAHRQAQRWLNRLGPKACLLAWLPVVGDPLCFVAGWLALPFWPCALYMLIGKSLRYISLTAVAMHYIS